MKARKLEKDTQKDTSLRFQSNFLQINPQHLLHHMLLLGKVNNRQALIEVGRMTLALGTEHRYKCRYGHSRRFAGTAGISVSANELYPFLYFPRGKYKVEL